VGRRLQARREGSESRVVVRLTVAYLAVFAFVIAALSVLAYVSIAAGYRDALAPALDTPVGATALASAERKIALAMLSIDLALLIVVGAASYALARAALQPLVTARWREERFAADAAHELRTPLGAIASVAQAARDGGPHDDAFAAIARRALEAGALVGDLLTLAREDDAEALVTEPVSFEAIVKKVAAETREAHPGIEISLDLSEAIVDGDERRLLQLTRNLLNNAERYAKTRIDVRVASSGAGVVLTVRDDGPGVPPDLVPELFERFSKSADSPGSGLGLAICRWIVNAHGGEITYAGGSSFVVRLPRRS
jgi:two-component system OmpR family sensor kinase